eukprot:TRINITY_DN12970_c0_g1_i1.p1 TRINITY_DN12970_c0_g1~~TRINITY_DN12970_c0_g1_i1.p1  ORF type:complete len:471 (+),score=125.74 TRINITY_DN12970_c0_g1_i1:64-1413(+)
MPAQVLQRPVAAASRHPPRIVHTLLWLACMQQVIRVQGAGKCTRKDLDIKTSYGTADGTGTLTDAMDNAYFCFNRAQTLIQKAIIGDEERRKAAPRADGTVAPDKLTGNIARHASHDCLTYNQYTDLPDTVYGFDAQCGGCNGSIRWEFQEAKKSDPAFSKFQQHAGLYKANSLLFGVQGDSGVATVIRKDKNKVCARMPDADIISIAGMVALIRRGALPSGGCTWYPGRVDAPPGKFDDTTSMAASPGSTVEKLLTTFKGLGFSMSDLEVFGFTGDRKKTDESGVYENYTEEDAQVADFVATLSGAHTIGIDRANPPRTNVIDPASGARMSTIVQASGPMDLTHDIFDAQYFKQVWEGGGNFASDRILKCATLPNPNKLLGNRVCETADSPFAPIVEEFAAGDAAADELFRQKFCNAYQAMMLAGYNVPADYAEVAQNFKFNQFPAAA